MKNKNNNVNSFINTKTKSWITPTYTFFVVAVPSFLIWFFFSKDFFGNQNILNIGIKILIAIGLILFVFLITSLLIYFHILNIKTLSFALPTSICFMIIFLTDSLEPWIRLLIVIPFIFLFIPINIMCKNIELRQAEKQKFASKKNNKKNIQ